MNTQKPSARISRPLASVAGDCFPSRWVREGGLRELSREQHGPAALQALLVLATLAVYPATPQSHRIDAGSPVERVGTVGTHSFGLTTRDIALRMGFTVTATEDAVALLMWLGLARIGLTNDRYFVDASSSDAPCECLPKLLLLERGLIGPHARWTLTLGEELDLLKTNLIIVAFQHHLTHRTLLSQRQLCTLGGMDARHASTSVNRLAQLGLIVPIVCTTVPPGSTKSEESRLVEFRVLGFGNGGTATESGDVDAEFGSMHSHEAHGALLTQDSAPLCAEESSFL